MMTRNGIVLSVAGGLLVSVLALPVQEARAAPPAQAITTSGRAVLLVGDSAEAADLALPTCSNSQVFLVQSVHVAPSVGVGTTAVDVVNLPRWAATVPVYQAYQSGAHVLVQFTVLGQGATHLSATLPAGQGVVQGGPGQTLPVEISLLGGVTATRRFEFDVHVSGVCGLPSLLGP